LVGGSTLSAVCDGVGAGVLEGVVAEGVVDGVVEGLVVDGADGVVEGVVDGVVDGVVEGVVVGVVCTMPGALSDGGVGAVLGLASATDLSAVGALGGSGVVLVDLDVSVGVLAGAAGAWLVDFEVAAGLDDAESPSFEPHAHSRARQASDAQRMFMVVSETRPPFAGGPEV